MKIDSQVKEEDKSDENIEKYLLSETNIKEIIDVEKYKCKHKLLKYIKPSVPYDLRPLYNVSNCIKFFYYTIDDFEKISSIDYLKVIINYYRTTSDKDVFYNLDLLLDITFIRYIYCCKYKFGIMDYSHGSFTENYIDRALISVNCSKKLYILIEKMLKENGFISHYNIYEKLPSYLISNYKKQEITKPIYIKVKFINSNFSKIYTYIKPNNINLKVGEIVNIYSINKNENITKVKIVEISKDIVLDSKIVYKTLPIVSKSSICDAKSKKNNLYKKSRKEYVDPDDYNYIDRYDEEISRWRKNLDPGLDDEQLDSFYEEDLHLH